MRSRAGSAGAGGAGVTRRQFVVAGAIGGAALAVGCKAGRQGGWNFLSDAQAATLTVICDQLIPADDFPSASQAGVLNYIDGQLVRHYRRHRNAYRDGLAQADEMSRKQFGRERRSWLQRSRPNW